MRKYRAIARELRAAERAAAWDLRVRRVLKAAPLVLVFALLNARSAQASCSFSPTPDPTVDGSSNSLRTAVQAANESGQNCQIDLSAGTYTLTIKNTAGQDNTAAEGDLDITSTGHKITIQGVGAIRPIINANGIDRAFQVLGGANASFRQMTIEGGVAQDDGTARALPGSTESEGGGVLVQDGGHVTFAQVALDGNQAIGGPGTNGIRSVSFPESILGTPGGPGQPAAGGGLFLSAGTIDLALSEISGNSATGGGGGLGANAVPPSNNSNVSSSRGGAGGFGAGGGAYVLSGSVRLSQSSVSDNNAAGGIGGNPGFPGAHSATAFVGVAGAGGAAQGAGLFLGGGTLRLAQTTVSANVATGGVGGGVSCEKEFGISCNIGQSKKVGPPPIGGAALGAGLFVAGGDVRVANSTFFTNTAKGGNGGLQQFHFNPPTSSITAQAAGGNSMGGGLYAGGGSLALTGVTVASNQALATSVEPAPAGASSGGGIDNVGAKLVTNTTLIGDNTQDSGSASNGNDVSGAIQASFSLFGQRAGATITDRGSNLLDVNPALDPAGLQENGGPTQTVALESNSPAIDTGDSAICATPPPKGLGAIDQRGFPRFESGESTCDLGAFEVQ